MTYLVAGLGNPGAAYAGTRHNVGFEAVVKLARDHQININTRKFRAITGTGVIAGNKVILALPQTYMNLSGESVRDIMGYFGVSPERLIVIYDDTVIALGDIRVRERGSAGSHNGMKSVIYQLETDEFARVRIGIGERPERWELKDYVLSRFSEAERDSIIKGINSAAEAVEIILGDSVQSAMNKFNKKQEKIINNP
ncbi:MAG: aminoacyl-tRNA hydrolase [Clostridiales bacterium]|jgi:PTH1 family peptidyl-tRNA hydrolase|nr:aminoacyl-tRNA hydrolase [Clostridiales bacterium]